VRHVREHHVERAAAQRAFQVRGRRDGSDGMAGLAQGGFEFGIRQRLAGCTLRKVQKHGSRPRRVFRLKSNTAPEHHQLVAARMERDGALAQRTRRDREKNEDSPHLRPSI